MYDVHQYFLVLLFLLIFLNRYLSFFNKENNIFFLNMPKVKKEKGPSDYGKQGKVSTY